MKLFKIDLSGLKNFIVPTLILITILIIIPFSFVPLLNNLKTTNDTLRQERERLGRLSDKLEILSNLDEESINEKLVVVESALPVGKSIAPLVVGIQNLAGGSNLKIEGINISPGQVSTISATIQPEEALNTAADSGKSSSQASPEEKDTLSLKVSLLGTIDNLKAFLFKLESAKRLTLVNNLSSEISESKSFKFTLQLSAPFRSIPRLAGDIAAQAIPLISDKNEKTLKLIEEFIDYTNIKLPESKTGVTDPFK